MRRYGFIVGSFALLVFVIIILVFHSNSFRSTHTSVEVQEGKVEVRGFHNEGLLETLTAGELLIASSGKVEEKRKSIQVLEDNEPEEETNWVSGSIHRDIGTSGQEEPSEAAGNGELATASSLVTVQGTVISRKTREPVEGARVLLMRKGSQPSGPKSEISKGDGSFKFEKVQSGSYRIFAEGGEYIKTEGPAFSVKAGQEPPSIVIEIEKGVELKGIIINQDRVPVAGAQIGCQSRLLNWNSGGFLSVDQVYFEDSVVTAEDGTFRVEHFSPTGDILIVSHERYAMKRIAVTPEMIGQEPVTVVMERGGSIVGLVVDEDLRPQSGLTIRYANEPEHSLRGRTVTDEYGEYRFDYLPAMTYTVTKEGRISFSIDQEFKQVAVREGEVSRADFGIGEGAEVRGTIYKENQPVPGAFIGLSYGEGHNDYCYFTRSQEDGTYSLKGVKPGQYIIYYDTRTLSSRDEFEITTNEGVQWITITEDQEEYIVDLFVRSYAIDGTVVDAETGKPLRGVMIHHVCDFQADRGTWNALRSQQTNENGTFEQTVKAPGLYRFVASKEGYTVAEFSVSIVSQQQWNTRISVEVQLSKSDTSIIAHVFYAGEPFFSDQLYFTVQKEEYRYRVQSKPGQRGVYHLSGLNEGRQFVSALLWDRTRYLMSYPEEIVLQKGQTGRIFLDLVEVIYYDINMNTSDDRLVDGSRVRLEIPDFPNAVYQPVYPLGNNLIRQMIPKGRHMVRLLVPGYRPVEFIPEEVALFRDGPQRGEVEVQLMRE